MNTLHKLLAKVAVGTFVLVAACAQSQVLYQDTNGYVGNFDVGNGEIGNQVSFPGNFDSYMITKFEFQFDFSGVPPALRIKNLSSNTIQITWATTSPRSSLFSTTDLKPPISWELVTNQPPVINGFYSVTVAATNSGQFFHLLPGPNGHEMADLRFYLNDGIPIPPSSNTAPGTIIFDSGQFSIGGFTQASKVIFRKEDLFGGAMVPQNFTWTVTFTGLTPNESAGLGLYEVTTVGTNFGAAWIRGFEGWQFIMAGIESPAPNFGAVAYGTPLPQLKSFTQGGKLMLSWPTNIPGFSIETTTNLLPPIHWSAVTNVSVVNDQNVLSNAADGKGAFFRLVNHSLPAF